MFLPENRNVVVSQAQRVALTIVAILKMGRSKMPNRLDDVQLNASLRSDFDANANPPSPTYISALHGRPPSYQMRNGSSPTALQMNSFGFTGRATRSEKSQEYTTEATASSGTLSSVAANAGPLSQMLLSKVHRVARLPRRPSSKSLGVLYGPPLRLALQTLVTKIPKGSPQRRIIKERLRIFTFGNPSIDWKVKNGTEHPSSKYAHTTEHFANETDFVAILGVVMPRDD
ncbi:hypothetical protein B0J15DRAFT_469665 [Fusarium solani]|uniref:Uncharacterized protein n=1 Tax=Fusarium solani TaxID=169388 RepID=A0A9P9GS64_FUSSL|nr:uncharacterized protein B0J15DRAFT_469665 [Fusarium solani]KAH7243743.1 hypothetical protein B0J15DRAFT_469665 [Fusarium solani]